jgi:signal transduction histidine kinase
MKAESTLLKLGQLVIPYAGVMAVLLAVIEVVVDWLTWIELNEAIVYSLPLILAAAARNRRLLWGLTIFLAATAFAVYFVQAPPGVFSLAEPFFLDRVLAVVTLLISAVLLHMLTLAIDALEENGRRIGLQNTQLDTANRELLRLKEEVSRQNMELDVRRQIAEESSNNKSRLLASVSHDIRSPLSAITLMAHILRQSADDPAMADNIPRLAQRLQANALSAAELVSEVLDMSSFDTGQVELHESEFLLNDLFEEQCNGLSPLAEAKGLTLKADPASETLWIRTDRLKLARVISNLVSNAIKFTETGEIILSAVLAPDGSPKISVRDTGIGIAREDLERVFDEFSRLHDPGHARSAGWGLGLAICRRLTNLMGGEISAISEPGHGSTFTITLPESCVTERPDEDQKRAAAP